MYLGENRGSVLRQTFVLDYSNWEIQFYQSFHNFLTQRVVNLSQAHIYWWAIQYWSLFSLKRVLNYLKRTKSFHFPKVVRKSSFVCWAAFQDAPVFRLRWKFCLKDTFHCTFNPENLIDSVDVTNTEGLPGLKLQGDNWGGKESVTKWKCGFIKTSGVCWNSEFFYFLLLRETSPANLASSVSPRELLQLAVYFCKCAQVGELGNIYIRQNVSGPECLGKR